MDLFLRDRVALVGGSSRGIGRAIAQRFLDEGARVVVTGRTPADVDRAAREMGASFPDPRAAGCVCDVSTTSGAAAAVAAAMDRFGRLDILIANAGTGTGVRGWDASDDEWARLIDANLLSAVRLIRAAVPALGAARDAVVVVTSSIAGVETLDAPLPYTVAKAGLIALTKTLSRSLAPAIRVNAVAPGNVLAKGGGWERRLGENPEDVQAYIEREVPMKRLGTPEEIADVVVFLASTRASFMTGSCIVIDGGQTRAF